MTGFEIRTDRQYPYEVVHIASGKTVQQRVTRHSAELAIRDFETETAFAMKTLRTYYPELFKG